MNDITAPKFSEILPCSSEKGMGSLSSSLKPKGTRKGKHLQESQRSACLKALDEH